MNVSLERHLNLTGQTSQEYESDDDNEPAVDLENLYYTSKQLRFVARINKK